MNTDSTVDMASAVARPHRLEDEAGGAGQEEAGQDECGHAAERLALVAGSI
jgi:hypothetical protein